MRNNANQTDKKQYFFLFNRKKTLILKIQQNPLSVGTKSFADKTIERNNNPLLNYLNKLSKTFSKLYACKRTPYNKQNNNNNDDEQRKNI